MSNNIDQSSLSNDLIRELIRERRSEKRWKNVRFFIGLLIISFILLILLSPSSFVTLGGPSESKDYVSYIKLEGTIDAGRDFSSENVLPKLREAFSDSQAKGVVLDINSGGGAPVQAAIIHDAILDLKKKYNKKVVAVGEDLMASGAYYVAVAADKIYVNPNTLTGSIGVIMKGFGLTDLIKKMGVDRRVYASGADKDRLDPFLPENPEDVAKIRKVINEVHDNFNQVVLAGRKGRLKASPAELFTGDFWPGQTALNLGLVDGLGNLIDAMNKEFHVSRYRDYSGTEGLVRSFMGQFGMALNFALNNEGVKVLEKL